MQNYTTKNTSVNTTRTPAVYGKVRWNKCPCGTIALDWGCGKDTSLACNLLSQYGIIHMGYDPNWKSHEDNSRAISLLGKASVFICSNVLNVIDDDCVVIDICKQASKHKHFFVAVYEGDKSGIGKRSKADCYQRNAKLKDYLAFFDPDESICIKNGVLTNSPELIK